MENGTHVGRISVIVPVYQSEAYIEACVNSVTAQTYRDFEVLLIDDGSTDQSAALCERLSARDDRVRLIRKANGGVSSARNMGLSNASGQWIMFVDSDDTIEPSMLAALAEHCDDQTDLVMSGMIVHFENKTVSRKMPDKLYTRTTLMNDLIKAYSVACFGSPCCKLFKTGVIADHKLRFDETVTMGEDMLFVLSYLEHCGAIVSAGYCGYHYVKTNPKSLTTRFDARYYDMRQLLYQTMIDASSAWNCSEEALRRQKAAYTDGLYNTLCQAFSGKSGLPRGQKKDMVARYLGDAIVKESLSRGYDKRRIFRLIRVLADHAMTRLMYLMLWAKCARKR